MAGATCERPLRIRVTADPGRGKVTTSRCPALRQHPGVGALGKRSGGAFRAPNIIRFPKSPKHGAHIY